MTSKDNFVRACSCCIIINVPLYGTAWDINRQKLVFWLCYCNFAIKALSSKLG